MRMQVLCLLEGCDTELVLNKLLTFKVCLFWFYFYFWRYRFFFSCWVWSRMQVHKHNHSFKKKWYQFNARSLSGCGLYIQVRKKKWYNNLKKKFIQKMMRFSELSFNRSSLEFLDSKGKTMHSLRVKLRHRWRRNILGFFFESWKPKRKKFESKYSRC